MITVQGDSSCAVKNSSTEIEKKIEKLPQSYSIYSRQSRQIQNDVYSLTMCLYDQFIYSVFR